MKADKNSTVATLGRISVGISGCAAAVRCILDRPEALL
jgi:hypothetical protein